MSNSSYENKSIWGKTLSRRKELSVVADSYVDRHNRESRHSGDALPSVLPTIFAAGERR